MTSTARSEASSGPEWPEILGEQLGWDVTVDAVDGSGFLTPGEDTTLVERARAAVKGSPDLVVLAGGKNDLGRFSTAEITAAADEATSRLADAAPDAQIVLLSPFSKGRPGPAHQRAHRGAPKPGQGERPRVRRRLRLAGAQRRAVGLRP